MKKLVLLSIILLGNVYAKAFVGVDKPLVTPGEPVSTTEEDGAYMYPILDKTSPEQKKICQDIKACSDKCAKNAVISGSKVPCFSKTYNLNAICQRGCQEMANYVTVQPGKSFDESPTLTLNGFDGTCGTILGCIDFYTKKKGWPYQCANIYCAYIDPEDSRQRDFAEAVIDPKDPHTKQPIFDKGFNDKDDQVPEVFRQAGSEY